MGFFCLFALVFQLALHPTRDLNLLGLSQSGAPELYSLKWLSLHYGNNTVKKKINPHNNLMRLSTGIFFILHMRKKILRGFVTLLKLLFASGRISI